MFTRHKFLLVTVKEWLKSVLNYRSYPKNKTGYPFFGPPCTYYEVISITRGFWIEAIQIIGLQNRLRFSYADIRSR